MLPIEICPFEIFTRATPGSYLVMNKSAEKIELVIRRRQVQPQRRQIEGEIYELVSQRQKSFLERRTQIGIWVSNCYFR